MGSIVIRRREFELKALKSAPAVYPWRRVEHDDEVPGDVDFRRIPDCPPRWEYSEVLMRALKGWLAALSWTRTGEVSNVELAIDFDRTRQAFP